MRTYEKSTHTAALLSDAAISATVSCHLENRQLSPDIGYPRSGGFPLEKAEYAEVLHTQPDTAALTRYKLLHTLSSPSAKSAVLP